MTALLFSFWDVYDIRYLSSECFLPFFLFIKASRKSMSSVPDKHGQQFRGHSQKTEISTSQPSLTLTKQQWDIRDAQLGMDTHIPDVQVNHKST